MAISQVSGNNSATSSAGVTTPTIDVAGIVSSLMAVEQQPITRLNNQISSYQSKISALGTVQSALSSFQICGARTQQPDVQFVLGHFVE